MQLLTHFIKFFNLKKIPLCLEGKESMTKFILHGAKILTEFKLLSRELGKCKIHRTKFDCKTNYGFI